jgi:tetratricopeptide (TPR) repeat protein
MTKTCYIFIILLYFVFGCAQLQDCVDGINKLPRFGGVKKCKQQLDDDAEFLASCDKLGSRKDLAAHMIMRGWEYFDRNVLDTAMMRFNQAWLLDSLNAEIYWGFGDILGKQSKFNESLPFFETALKINPNNSKTWMDESTSFGNLFFQARNKKYLDSTIYAIKKAISLSPNRADLYAKLTAGYSYYMQKDSARKYLKITNSLDPNAVNPEVRKMIVGN